MILNGIMSYLGHHQTNGHWENSVHDAFDAILTESWFEMHALDVAAVVKILGLSKDDHVYKTIDRDVDMKENGDLFTPEVSKTGCDWIGDIVALVCNKYSNE